MAGDGVWLPAAQTKLLRAGRPSANGGGAGQGRAESREAAGTALYWDYDDHLRQEGYRLAGGEIRGLKVYAALADIPEPIDMVQVFRDKSALYGITEEAIAVGAKVLWGQIGVVDPAAARLAEEAGMKVVMDRCPKIELFRPFWKPRLNQEI